jgi:serine/threonine-protein kinase
MAGSTGPDPDEEVTAFDKPRKPAPPTPGTAVIAGAGNTTASGVIAGTAAGAAAATAAQGTGPPPPTASLASLTSSTLTTAADAMRDEEITRTRLFIRMGWVISVATIGVVPFLPAPRVMDAALIGALVLGMIVSFYFHQTFAKPGGYTERGMETLAIVAVFNSNVAVLYFGALTVAPVILVVGIHFVARTESVGAAKRIWAMSAALHAAMAVVIVSGVVADPGVFASDAPVTRVELALGALFVQGMYALAFYTARAFRGASLQSIEQLQHATRLASQREALMAELRADLERALRVGGPGRYTDQTVGGFKLGVVLGRGAMGEVYDATHIGSGEPAAVKLLRRELLTDPTHVARFLREARAAGALASPHVVKLLDTAPDDAPVPYLAMERLHGATLAELLRSDPRLGVADVGELLTQIAAGIDAAAAAGIVHRDLKPQNLFRCDGAHPLWKILDFGVATLAEDAGTLTQGGIVGTPAYMAPEQARGDRVDSRADVYAIAAVAYRCLTARHPFSGSDTPAVLYAVVHRAALRPGALVDVPADVDRWAAIALAKSRSDRFADGAELAAAYTAAVRGELDGKLRKKADALIRALPWEGA